MKNYTKQTFILLIIILTACTNPEKAYDKACQVNTIESYNRFIERYSDSPLVEQAIEQIIQLEFEKAKEINSKEVFQTFVNKYPEHQLSLEALFVLENLEWESIKNSEDLSNFKEFIKNYPDSKYLDTAIIKLEMLEYIDLIDNPSAKKINNFLTNYPENNQKETLENSLVKISINNFNTYTSTVSPYGSFSTRINIGGRNKMLFRGSSKQTEDFPIGTEIYITITESKTGNTITKKGRALSQIEDVPIFRMENNDLMIYYHEVLLPCFPYDFEPRKCDNKNDEIYENWMLYELADVIEIVKSLDTDNVNQIHILRVLITPHAKEVLKRLSKSSNKNIKIVAQKSLRTWEKIYEKLD